MKSTAKTLALGAALLCLLAGGMALPASAAVPLTGHRRVAALEQRQQRACREH